MNGNLVYNYSSPEAQRALQFVSELTFVYKGYKSNGNKYYTTGNVAITFNDAWNHNSVLNSGLNSITASPPKGPDMPEYVKVTTSANMLSVNALCDIPREAATIGRDISILWELDGSPVPEWSDVFNSLPIPWESSSRIASSEKEYFILNLRTDVSVVCDYSSAIGITSYINDIASKIMGGANVYTTVEAVRNEIEAIMYDYNNLCMITIINDV